MQGTDVHEEAAAPGGSASSCCGKSSASGTAGPPLSSPTSVGGPGPRAAAPLASYPSFAVHQSLCSLPAGFQHKPGALLRFGLISWGSEERKLSFKLSNPFLCFSQACTGASSYPIRFLGIPGFCAFVLSGLSPRFSRARLLPVMVSILTPAVHAPQFCF